MIASLPFAVIMLWSLLGCTSPAHWSEYKLNATVVVLDRAQLCAMVGMDVDGWTDFGTMTIYVSADKGCRPLDWIVGHEVKHLLFGRWHDGVVGKRE
jgi:hypothetical protein